MLYSLFLTILIAVFVSIEIYFLGKHLSITSKIYKFNESTSIVIGAILYFVITFFTFFIFVWIQPTILYYVVVFFIKELIQITFLFLRRDVFKGMKVNFKTIGSTVVAMVIFPLMFNYGFNSFLKLEDTKQINDFQTWILYQNVLSEFTNVDIEFISKWLIGAISSLVIYNIVASFIMNFSKRKSPWNYILGMFATLGLLLLFNFGQNLNSLVGVFLILFSVQLSVDIIMRSRRRYAIIIGLIDITIWFFDPHIFFAMFILSIATSLIYTYLKKNKASMFWVQLVSPLFLIGSLWVYTFSVWGALFFVIISITLYIFMIGIGRLESLDKFDAVLKKTRIILPLTLIIATIIMAISIAISNNMSKEEIWLFNDPIWESYNNKTWNTIQQYLYYISLLFAASYLMWSFFKKLDNKNIRIIIAIASLLLLIGYVATINVISYNTLLSSHFKYLRATTFMPLTLIGSIFIKKKLKIKERYVKASKKNRKWR